MIATQLGVGLGAADTVVIDATGCVSLGGYPLGQRHWRIGRTGTRKLRQYLALLVVRYPTPVTRDELADRLWPESDGDRAIRNLYAATSDLRRFLHVIPDAYLCVEEGGYRLDLPGWQALQHGDGVVISVFR